MRRLIMFLAAAERERAARGTEETLDVETEAQQILMSYPGLEATVSEVAAILRDGCDRSAP